MKKLLIATALTLVSAAAAQARVDIGVNIGEPAYAPVYVEPAPVYVEPRPVYYQEYGRAHHQHNYDYGYWNRPHAPMEPHPAPHTEPHPAPYRR